MHSRFLEIAITAGLNDAFQRVDRWGYWPTLSVRYFYPDVLRPLRDDPRYQELLREVDRSWGLDPGGGEQSPKEIP